MSNNGALTQLVAVGAQEQELLTDDPKFSVFQQNVGKINNFVKATTSNFSLGSSNWDTTLSFKIKKDGDMLSSAYLVIELPELSKNTLSDKIGDLTDFKVRWVDYLGYSILESAKLLIGGQLIEEVTGDFSQIYTDLYEKEFNKICLLGMDPTLTTPQDTIRSTFLYIPLKFWFSENVSKALPLVALQYHDVEFEIKLRKWDDLVQLLEEKTDSDGTKGFVHNPNYSIPQQSIKDVRLDCNLLFLDSEDRKRVAQSEHKFLITQTQRISHSVSQGKNLELNFKHPVKEMFFYLQNNFMRDNGELFNFSNKMDYPTLDMFNKTGFKFSTFTASFKNHLLDKARILINSYPRVDWKDFKYYYYLQNYENYRTKTEHLFYMYSFSANPKFKDPMGSLNFSRIDNAQLQFNLNTDNISDFKSFLPSSLESKADTSNFDIVAYGVNYNYLRIASGMGGIVYNN